MDLGKIENLNEEQVLDTYQSVVEAGDNLISSSVCDYTLCSCGCEYENCSVNYSTKGKCVVGCLPCK